MGEKLFPKFMSEGSKGKGVAVLQCLLIDRGHNAENIVIDGFYRGQTAEGVRLLQKELGVEEDGRFGPATRKALAESGGINVNKIEAEPFNMNIMVATPS